MIKLFDFLKLKKSKAVEELTKNFDKKIFQGIIYT